MYVTLGIMEIILGKTQVEVVDAGGKTKIIHISTVNYIYYLKTR